jgi:hypothetical protein
LAAIAVEEIMSKMTITCTEFRPWQRNTLVGFAVVNINELKLTIKDISIHEKGESRWAALPAKPVLKDGTIVKDDTGKAQYVNILEFADGATRTAFSAAVVAAVLEHTPTAFETTMPRTAAAKTAGSEIPF